MALPPHYQIWKCRDVVAAFSVLASQFQPVAIGIAEIKRLAPAGCAVPFGYRADSHAVSFQMAPHFGCIEAGNSEAEMIHVVDGVGRYCLACEQVDERAAHAQMGEPDIVTPPIQHAAENFAVEPDGAIEIGHPDDDMIDSGDFHKRLFARAISSRQGTRACNQRKG